MYCNFDPRVASSGLMQYNRVVKGDIIEINLYFSGFSFLATNALKDGGALRNAVWVPGLKFSECLLKYFKQILVIIN